MERSLLWSAFAIGWIGWLYGFLLTRTRQAGQERSGIPRPFVMAAGGLPLLVFLATLPSRPPFAAGQGFGRGFLLGGLAALLAGWTAWHACRNLSGTGADMRSASRAAAAVAAPFALALVVAATPLLFLRETLLDALLGGAIGWLCVSLTLLLGTRYRQEEADAPLALPLVAGTGFALTVCALAALGEFRAKAALTSGVTASWSAQGLAFAAGVPFALLLGALPTAFFARIALKLPLAGFFARLFGGLFPDEAAQNAGVRVWRMALSAILLLGLGKLLALRVLEQPHLFRVMGLGLLVGLAAWWLAAGQNALAGNGWYGALAALVVLAGAMAAFQMLAGFGVGLLLIAAWLVVGACVAFALEPGAESGIGESRLSLAAEATRLALFGVALLLYRLVMTRFTSDLKGVSLTDNYALFGFLAGALLPSLLSGFLLRPGTPMTAGSALFRLVLTALLVLAAPAFILLLWGAKCAVALVLGLALGVRPLTPSPSPQEQGEGSETASFTLIPSPSPSKGEGSQTSTLPSSSPSWSERKASGDALPSPLQGEGPGVRVDAWRGGLFVSLLSLAVILALAQWTHHALAWALLTRAEKIRILAWVVGCLIALILVSDYGTRFGAWWRRRRQGSAAPAATKGAAP
ncbi:MAG TPA: hypothetical protein VFB21_26235 [Chthonomonadaceae bacterium]|nr:hypothetical protein [Chthonomonadaceae bacterium]